MMKLDNVYKPNNHYKVIVKTITFNQSKYIQETLKGIAIQETDFPFVNVVLEDCSTDGEQDVIRSWIGRECDMTKAEFYDIPTSEIVIVPHRINTNCTFAIYFHKENLFHQKEKRDSQIHPWLLNSEYMAFCEGDDYWTNDKKLQTQVSFLDANPEYGMCYTQCNFYIQSQSVYKTKAWGGPNELFSQFMRSNTVPTLTVLYRTELENKFLEDIVPGSRGWLMGDYPRWIWFSHESRIKYIPLVTGVYRVLASSASHSSDINKQIRFSQSAIEIRRFFEGYFNVPAGTYVDANAFDRRKMYLFAINHKFLDFLKMLISNPKLLLNFKILGYFRYFLMKKKRSEEV